ncbi:hypothetical protein ACFL3T_05245 [Patescibacteria group bacterium]
MVSETEPQLEEKRVDAVIMPAVVLGLTTLSEEYARKVLIVTETEEVFANLFPEGYEEKDWQAAQRTRRRAQEILEG